jgi:hypothetical protein
MGWSVISVWRAAPKSMRTAQINVRRLEVEMQQLVRVHFAQAVEHAGEHAAHEALGNVTLVFLDELLQRPAMLVLHDHVNRVVGAKKIQHANHVGMRQAGQGAAFLEEALHAVAEGTEVFGGNDRVDFTARAQGQTVRQVFLDGNLAAGGVGGQIDNGKAAKRKLAVYCVLFQQVAVR